MGVDPSSLFHIVNPNAARRGGVRALLETKPWERIWIERKTHPTHLETAVHWAVNEGRSAIAVWGGDGSLSRVVNALNGLGALSTVAVALFPVGTCNDLARHLKLPSWDAATREGASLVERRIDVGVMTHAEGEHLFVNNAGFGRRPEARRDRRPNPIADIFRLRPQTVDIRVRDGAEQRAELDVLLGIVFNAPYFGGGMHFSNAIRSNDGILDGYFVQEQSRLKLLWSFARGRSGRAFQNERTVSLRGESLSVRAGGDLFPQADGESASVGAVKEIDFTVRRDALRLLVPADNHSGKE